VAQIVEIARLLRKDSAVRLKREPRRGLAQSTGGLASNNFVTIVERADPGRQSVARPTPPMHQTIRPVTHERGTLRVPSGASEGVIETFTIVYTTPDGFLPPLALALIRDRHGSRVMAQGEEIGHLKIGREVYLRQAAGILLFTVKNPLQQVGAAIQKLLGKGAHQEESALTGKPKH
jgi:hypothetical protein